MFFVSLKYNSNLYCGLFFIFDEFIWVTNYNDFNVNRGNEYAHIATVKAIGQVNIDSRVISNTFGYQVNMYNTTLDCHADWRPLQINSWPGVATINIVNADGTACTWLHVSTIHLNQAVNNGRVTYNPATDMVSILALISKQIVSCMVRRVGSQ